MNPIICGLTMNEKKCLYVTGKLMQVVFGHWDVVTCLGRSESYIGGNCYILSGSRDATLLLWYWNGKTNSIGDNTNGKEIFILIFTYGKSSIKYF